MQTKNNARNAASDNRPTNDSGSNLILNGYFFSLFIYNLKFINLIIPSINNQVFRALHPTISGVVQLISLFKLRACFLLLILTIRNHMLSLCNLLPHLLLLFLKHLLLLFLLPLLNKLLLWFLLKRVGLLDLFTTYYLDLCRMVSFELLTHLFLKTNN